MGRRLVVVLVVMVVLVAAVPASAARVLLLGDGGAEAQAQAALETAGHAVTYGGLYYNWNGSTPNPNNFDMIVALDGEDYGYDFTPGAKTALSAFVASGRTLLFTAWTAYDVAYAYKGDPIGDLMPTTYAGSYAYADTWTVVAPGDPLVAGVPGSWPDAAGYSRVTAKPGTIVLVTGTGGNPLFSYSTANGGMVFHLNHDMTYTTDIIEPNALRLIVNAAGAAPVPAVGRYGAALLAVLLGLAGIGLLARRRAA